ncbi:amidohydrolase [Kribbella jiaozuonensis]|uniref:Amidohydrolase n=1 Tax=Kribbella jiaozuonensis TaxID=2575441 RepID=A0A4U3LMH0_9ACTN|nr:amidohydrolase [Kribbella jiaozuonensis]TKK76284.1 amidohydrolase [Kribbella jiaozuonensis]
MTTPSLDLIVYGGTVWTADPNRPLASAFAVAGDRIVQVGEDAEILSLAGEGTEVLDLAGRMVCPGFNDAHTHFENAVDWHFQVALTDVNDQARLEERVAATAARLTPGVWITGGDLGDFASTREDEVTLLEPDLAAIDALTPDNPLLIRRADHQYFANSKALGVANIDRGTPDPRGGRFGRDAGGELTGMLYGQAGEFVHRLVTPMSLEQKLIGARGVMARLNAVGITSIHDIARLPSVTEETIPPVFLERSFSNAQIFQTLADRGELSVRVYAFLPLDTHDRLAGHGVTPKTGDDWLRFGALKIFVDSGAMLPPFDPADAPGTGLTDGWSYRFVGEERLAELVLAGDAAGFDIGVHVQGDRGCRIAIDAFERAALLNGPRDRRHRLIHAWHLAAGDFARAGKLGLVADVTSDQLLLYSTNLDAALGAARSANAFAWRRMIDSDITVNLVSDLPGAFNKSHVAEIDPLRNMYAAITRTACDAADGEPFHPDQAITIDEALLAYTANPAYSSHEEDVKGTITPGKLADFIILTENIRTGPPEVLLRARVDRTYLAGRLVHTAD